MQFAGCILITQVAVGPVGCRLSGVLQGCGGTGRIHLPQRQLKHDPLEEKPIRFLESS